MAIAPRIFNFVRSRGRLHCAAWLWLLALPAGLLPTAAFGQQVQWIWNAEQEAGKVPLGSCYFRKAFRMIDPERGQLQISANDRMEIFLNGVRLGTATGSSEMKRFDIGPHMLAGVNVLAVRVDNLEGKTAGLAAAIVVKEKNESQWRMTPTDSSWRATTDPRGQWMSLAFDDSSWGKSQQLAQDQDANPGANDGSPAETAAAIAPPAGNASSTPTNSPATADGTDSAPTADAAPADSTEVTTAPSAQLPPAQAVSTRESAPAFPSPSDIAPSGRTPIDSFDRTHDPSTSSTPPSTTTSPDLPPIVPPPAAAAAATPATTSPTEPTTEIPQFEIDPEFEVALVADGTLGSYIAMEFDEFGRLIVSRENAGLARIDFTTTPEDPERTQAICDQVKNCQGILPLNGKIYVTGEGLQGWGLYLLADADCDANFESVDLIARFEGTNAEHGPHGLTLGPDGNIYLIVGNHARLDKPVASTSPYAHPYEADLVPRIEDPGGHAVGIKAPGGTILRMPIQSREFELVAGGIRNAYDLAFDAAGELYFHDSDMESDEGTPWYRPTMLFQVLAGGEYGWRSGWAKYPTFYLDCVPPADSTGRGSPTGAAFYHHIAFPARYHDALFLADWSEGRILVSRLTRHGSTTRALTRPFLSAAALNVTDLTVGPDGALYFCTGGRGTQGSIGRIAWRGEIPKEILEPPTTLLRVLMFPQPESAWARQALAKLRKQAGEQWNPMLLQAAVDPSLPARFRVRALDVMTLYGPAASSELLERLAGDLQAEVRVAAARVLGSRPAATAQPVLERLLSDDEPWVRRVACESLIRCNAAVAPQRLANSLRSLDQGEAFAARRLLERIPSEQWRDMILTQNDPRIFLQGAAALLIAAPSLESSYAVLARASEYFDGFVADADFIDFLRVIQLALTQSPVEPEKIPAFVFRMGEEFPSANALINRELAKILAFLQVTDMENRYAEYLEQSQDPHEHKLMVALMLQTLAEKLEPRDRLAVLAFLEQSLVDHPGGGSYEGYVAAAATRVAQYLSDDERDEVWTRGAAWPNAVTAALFQLPAQPDAETIDRLIAIDRDAQSRQDASTRKLRAGLAAVLLSSENPEALDHVIRNVATLHEPIAIETLIALSEIDYQTADPEHCRQILAAAQAYPGAGASAAISLLEHWTGESHGDADDAPAETLEHWFQWYRETFPAEQPISTRAATTSTPWTVDSLLAEIRSDSSPRDPVRGEQLYQQAQCARCHRLGNLGEGSGPDLTAIGRRFNIREILEATIDPSAVISDQYRGKRITTGDGKVFAGQLTVQPDGRWVVLQSNGEQKTLDPADVDNLEDMRESTMPGGLLDGLSAAEVADLLHYLTAENPDRFAQGNR